MGKTERIRAFIARARDLWLAAAITSGVLALAWCLVHLPAWYNPLVYHELQFASGILALAFAAAAVVRFRVTSDRLSLILASGLLIVGAALAIPNIVFFSSSSSGPNIVPKDPTIWVIGRTFLALLFVAAFVVEKRIPTARNTASEIAVPLLTIGVCSAALTMAAARLTATFVIIPGTFFPRAGNLVPGGLFLLAAVQYRRRLARTRFPFDHALYYSAVLNVACSVAASLSKQLLGTFFLLAEFLQFISYAILLGGALFDDMHLFEDIRNLSLTDPLTGLANYRKLIDVLQNEIQRSERTGSPFALALFDLDGLKKINDRHGHLAGSRALCRVANTLCLHSRSIDTCARYGGDEFALVLPETTAEEARDAADRICKLVAEDAERPPLSISHGIATYPDQREGIESLIREADQSLYHSKRRNILNLDSQSLD